MPKILVLNPVSTNKWDNITRELLKKYSCPYTEFSVKSLKKGPVSIESSSDIVMAAPYVVKEVIEAEREGYDSVIINCFDDPGVDAARERASILILGIGETSMISALHLGYKIAVISTGENSRAVYDLKALKLGIRDRLAYASGIPVRVLDLRSDEEKTKRLLLSECRKAVEEYGAEVIVLGCSGMIGYSDWLSKKLKIPVIDPTIITFKIAESLSFIHLRHSKRFLYKVINTHRRDLGNKDL